MGACTGSLKVNASVAFICGFSGKTKYAAHRFVSSGFLCGESCGYIEVGMMISETVSHFFHIKVTAGSIRGGGGGGGSGGGGGGVLCRASFGKHWIIWLLRLHQEVGIPSLQNRRGSLNRQQPDL